MTDGLLGVFACLVLLIVLPMIFVVTYKILDWLLGDDNGPRLFLD